MTLCIELWPLKRHFEVLIASACECDLIWKWSCLILQQLEGFQLPARVPVPGCSSNLHGSLNHFYGAFFPAFMWPVILLCLVYLMGLPCVNTHLLAKMGSSEEAYKVG